MVERKIRKAGRTYIYDILNENSEVDMEGLESAICLATNKKLFYSTCNVYASAIFDLWNYNFLVAAAMYLPDY